MPISKETESAERMLLKAAYQNFNLRDIDAVLASLHPDVEWANGMEGGYVHGREAVRAYWSRQWEAIDPRVEPSTIERMDNGGYLVKVHQIVRDKQGKVLVDKLVHHAYQFDNGRIKRMDILIREREKNETNS